MKSLAVHKNGDWLVHQYYGVGQLKGKEMKHIGGEDSIYFRLEMDNTTIYIPEDKLNGEWFRPIASENTLAEMEAVLARPCRRMDKNFLIRKNHIRQVMTENSIVSIARTVRDLSGRQRRRKSLSQTEENALRTLKSRLLTEWAVASGLKQEQASERLNLLLKENHE